MTTLYRSPTVLIADHEWHLCVVKLGGRVYRRYKFRPVSTRAHAWRPADKWTGRPFKLWRDFKYYIPHAKAAERYEKERLMYAFRAEMRAVKNIAA